MQQHLPLCTRLNKNRTPQRQQRHLTSIVTCSVPLMLRAERCEGALPELVRSAHSQTMSWPTDITGLFIHVGPGSLPGLVLGEGVSTLLGCPLSRTEPPGFGLLAAGTDQRARCPEPVWPSRPKHVQKISHLSLLPAQEGGGEKHQYTQKIRTIKEMRGI